MAAHNDSAFQKNIVILGGSYSGLSTAHYLLKHAIPQLPNGVHYQIVVVSTSSQAMCRPACPRALISDGMFPQDKLFVDVPKAFEQYSKDEFRFINGTAKELDHKSRTVSIDVAKGSAEKIEFHALVIATGASTPSPLLGLNRDEHFLRANWTTFRKALPTAKTIVIAGGGPAGIETAGELGEHFNGHAGWFASRLSNPKVSITVVTSDSKILPALRPALAKKAEDYLAKVGVNNIIKNSRVTSVSPEGAGSEDVAASATLTLDNGKTLDADLYIPTTGTIPNTDFVSSSLLTANKRITTNPSTLRVDAAGPRIYAIGDVASLARPAIHLILDAVPILCANIKRDLSLFASASASVSDNSRDVSHHDGVGNKEDRIFKEDKRETQLVPIGRRGGVGAVMGWRVPSFLVWAIKGRDYWLWTTGGLWSWRQWSKEK